MKSYPNLRLLLAAATLFASGCERRPEVRPTRVLVTGEASLRAQPDTAVVILSVVTQGQRALETQQQNARKSEAVINAVKGVAGANPEIKTSDYSLQPQQTWRDNRMPSIIGYEARNTVTVTLPELNSVGAVIDAASQAGANSVERVSFVLRENNPAHGETLAEATRQAVDKAQAIAKAMGGRVVRIVEEQEGGVLLRPPLEDERMSYDSAANSNMSAAKASPRYSTPVEAGSLNVKSQVQLIVEVEAKP